MRSSVDIVRDHYAAGAKGDVGGMVADFAPDLDWKSMAPVTVHLTGPDAVVKNVFGTFPGLYKSFRVDIEKLHDAGDTVFMVGHYAGTSNRGEDFRVRVTHKWSVGNGKIRSFEQFADSTQMKRAQSKD